MITRERLWQRLSGASLWPLAWGMVLACGWPWILPEGWSGVLPKAGVWAGWSGAGLCLGLLVWPRLRWIPALVVLPWICLMGLARLAQWEAQLPRGVTEVQGTISRPWRQGQHARTGALRVTAPAGLAGCEVPVVLPAEGSAPPPPGTPVRVRAALDGVDPAPRFIGERPWWRALQDREPRRLRLRGAEQLECLGPARPGWVLRLQTWLHQRFESLPLEGLGQDLWGALTLGRNPVLPEATSVFAESGTLHLLVVSGLQITLVMGLAAYLGHRLLRRGGSILAMALGLTYALAVGFSAPVWRGWIMGLVWLATRSRGWTVPPVLALHGALALWMLVHPASGCDPGFLLAWWALLGLLWGAEPLAGLLAPLLGTRALPLARVAAPWFSTLPLLALLHGGAPVWGIPANLLLLPAVAVLTPVCLLLTLFPWLGLVELLGRSLSWLGSDVVPLFARIQPLATAWLAPWVMLALGWLVLAQAQGRFRRTRALVLGLVLVSVGLLATRGVGRSPQTLTVEGIDVGQGDALLVRVPGASATLIDTGTSPWAARRIARVLSRRGVREPLHLVLTHPHSDHVGGWSTLVRLWWVSDMTRPATTDLEPWVPFASPAMLAETRTVLRGDAWRRGPAQFQVQWPPKPFRLSDANALSLVLRVRWEAWELWFMGDAMTLQEQDLLDLGDPGTWQGHRWLKPGHHGASSANHPAWLEALRPQVVMITAGRHNTFGFPHSAVLESLQRVGASWYLVGPSGGLHLSLGPAGGWTTAAGAPPAGR